VVVRLPSFDTFTIVISGNDKIIDSFVSETVRNGKEQFRISRLYEIRSTYTVAICSKERRDVSGMKK
jgi:hypothetical protein